MLPLGVLCLSGVRSNHLSYRPSPPPPPSLLRDATTPRRKRGNTPLRTTWRRGVV